MLDEGQLGHVKRLPTGRPREPLLERGEPTRQFVAARRASADGKVVQHERPVRGQHPRYLG
jgi:hypothetical protein